MSGEVFRKALASAERCIPSGADNRSLRISLYVQGYMTGHAAHTRWASKTISDYREAKARRVVNGSAESK